MKTEGPVGPVIVAICCDYELPEGAPCPCGCHYDTSEALAEAQRKYDAVYDAKYKGEEK